MEKRKHRSVFMKNPKIIYHISWVFALVSLVCIGFSSWNITNQIGGQSLTGSIKADNVVQSTVYISFDKSADVNDGNADGLEVFEYYEGGFIVDNVIRKVATLKAHYIINLNPCIETFGAEYDSLQAIITLRATSGQNSLNIFTGISGTTVNATLSQEGGIGTTETPQVSAQLYTYTINFNNILKSDLETYKFTITYTFDVQDFDAFYAVIGSEPIFHTSAKITGVN